MAASNILPNATLDKFINNFNELKSVFSSLTDNPMYNYLCNEFISPSDFHCKFSNNFNFSFMHINIRSLNSKLLEFIEFIKELKVSFSVIIISEVWSTNLGFFHNILPGYNLLFDLPTDSHVGGVAIFHKSDLNVNIRSELKLSTSTSCKVENIWISLSVNNLDIYLGALYRHPNGDVEEFCTRLENTLANIPSSKTVIVTGDFNFNLLLYDTNNQVKRYTDLLLMNSFLPVLLLPTRITGSSISLIDHVFIRESISTNSLPLSVKCGNILDDISDHLPNFCFISKPGSFNHTADRPLIRLYNDRSKKSFNSELQHINWDSIFKGSKDANWCYVQFLKVMNEVYERAFPLVRVSRRASKDKPWFTAELRKKRQKKFVLYHKWFKTKKQNDLEEYKNFVKEYKIAVKKACSKFYSKQFDCKTNTITQLWGNLRKIICNKNNCKNQSIEKLEVNGQILFNDNEIAENLNQHFCSLGSKIAYNLQPSNVSFETYLTTPVADTIFVKPVDTSELIQLIESLETHKAAGEDGFPIFLVKENKDLFTAPLLYIFNLSLTTGVIPDKMKIAKVIPIFKKGDKTNLNNYRPISLLSVFNKMLEKIVYVRLQSFLKKNKVLYDYQFGFRTNYSTSLALMEIVDNCYNNIDQQNIVLGLFLDFEKAFDTVFHPILLDKLYHYGIRGIMYRWLKNYLLNRKQYTYVNGVNSDMLGIEYGVPQGSILGPLLFLVYINDMHNALENEFPRLFADDTNLFLIAPTLDLLQTKVNSVTTSLESWLLSNKLSLNTSKTTFMVIKTKRIKQLEPLNISVKIFGRTIEQVSSSKYLGVFIDNELSWRPHIDFTYNKLLKFCGIFYKMRELIPAECARCLYFSFINSVLLYGVEVYGNSCLSNLNKLIILNNKLLRILLNKPVRTPTAELYYSYNILPINVLHEYQLLKVVHKILYYKSQVPNIFADYFVLLSEDREYSLRDVYMYNVKIFRLNTCTGQRSFFYKGAKLWNQLPIDIKCCKNIRNFNANLKNLLFNIRFN